MHSSSRSDADIGPDANRGTSAPPGPAPEPLAQARVPQAPPHSVAEDLQAMLLATLVTSVGMALLAGNSLIVGGMAGAALLLHYATGLNFGLLFALLNLPFYWLAVRGTGWRFAINTFIAVNLVAVATPLIPRFADLSSATPGFSAVVGGMLAGIGILFFVRHRASLGGVNILALHLQRTRGWRAGNVQIAIDLALMALALLVLEPGLVLYSALGAVVLSLVLTFNHRPGRYMGM